MVKGLVQFPKRYTFSQEELGQDTRSVLGSFLRLINVVLVGNKVPSLMSFLKHLPPYRIRSLSWGSSGGNPHHLFLDKIFFFDSVTFTYYILQTGTWNASALSSVWTYEQWMYLSQRPLNTMCKTLNRDSIAKKKIKDSRTRIPWGPWKEGSREDILSPPVSNLLILKW